jgi:hypothetical protein
MKFPDTPFMKLGILIMLSLGIFLVDLHINQEIFEYLMNFRLGGYALSAAMAGITSFIPHYIGFTISRKQFIRTALASAFAVGLFTFLILGQIEIGHGVYASFIVILLFLLSALFSAHYEEEKHRYAPIKRKLWIEKHLPEFKAQLMALENKLTRDMESVMRDAENQVTEIQKTTEKRIQDATKKRDHLSRAEKDELKRLRLLMKKLNKGIDDSYDSFGEPELL